MTSFHKQMHKIQPLYRAQETVGSEGDSDLDDPLPEDADNQSERQKENEENPHEVKLSNYDTNIN